MSTFRLGLALLCGVAASLIGSSGALAVPCLANPSCTLDGQTFTTTGGSSGDGLTFIASFTTPNQSNASIAQLVVDYLALSGVSVTYLGRQDGSGLIGGDNVTATPAGGLTGTWSFTPGTTGDIGAYVAIHAGEGQTDELFAIDSPGLSGTWGTENGHGLSNFDLFGTPAPASVPEPTSLALLAGALLGFAALRRRRNLS
jgi:PEP-CTERM motif-containing protein